MARHNPDRFERDEDDVPSLSKGKRGLPGLAVVFLCSITIIAVLAIGGMFAYFASERRGEVRIADGQPVQKLERLTPRMSGVGGDAPMIAPEANASLGTKKVYSRDEFKELVMGKTLEELTASIGRPDVSVSSDFGLTHHYLNRTKNPETGNVDALAELTMKDGKVVRVTY